MTDRDALIQYLDAAATYHARTGSSVQLAGTTFREVLRLCGEQFIPLRMADVYNLTPAEARRYARQLRESGLEGAA